MAAPLTIREKLANVQMHIRAIKERYNGFGKYNYRSAEDIVNSVKKTLKDLNYKDTYLLMSDEIIMIGNRFYIKAKASLCDANGEITVDALARESEDKKGMDSAQVTGSTSSYARKYALNGLFALDDNEDVDSLDNSKPIPSKPILPKNTPAKPVNNSAMKNNDNQIIIDLQRDLDDLLELCTEDYRKKVLDYVGKNKNEKALQESIKRVQKHIETIS